MNTSSLRKTLPQIPRLLAVAVGLVALPAALHAAVLVDLDATQLPEGPLATWANKGVTTGDFTSAGTSVPEVAKRKAGKGVATTGTAHYVGPVAPEAVTGNGSRTVEAWVFNPTQQGEETVFAWGRRGGPDGSNCSLGHGTDTAFGAVGHWGAPDIGWEGNITFNEWTYLVYTYDGPNQTTTVYRDGQLANSEVLDAPLNTWAVSTAGGGLPFRLARQSADNGTVSTVGAGDLTIGKIRVHDAVLDAAAILAKYNAEVDTFIERDTDSDGMPDWWETLYPDILKPNDAADATGDPDTDSLTNLQEYQQKTVPNKADTDEDGANDGAEVNRKVNGVAAPTDPTKADTDGDGLRDGAETGTGSYQNPQNTGTDPLKTDTDEDAFGDWQEVLRGSNPTSASSTPQIESPLVLLDATQLPVGPLATWTNTGVLPGNFAARDANAAPEITTILGVRGVRFDGAEYYTGPAAPLWVTGNGAHTVEAWVYNPAVADEETIFSWGRRGGPDASNCSFNHGGNASYGAVGHWGGPDIGWDGNIVAGQWTHVAYSWNPGITTQTVYKDGQVAATEDIGFELSIWATADNGASLPFRIASQNDANGAATEGLRGSLSIAKLVVYDATLSDTTIQQHFSTDAGVFGILDEDNDGMPTWYERGYSFLNPNDPSDAAKDQDSDGLSNLQEYQLKTLPDNPDTDDDGAADGAEVNTLKTMVLVSDTDQDGLPDGREGSAGTDPLKPDTDGDTYLDGLEAVRGSDPKAAASVPSFSSTVAIIDLNASGLPAGSLAYWTNNGALHGRFKASSPAPVVQTVGGATSVTFDGQGYYLGPVAPLWMTGNSPRTIEAWVYNPTIDDEENVFSWGRRGGPDGSNCSFNHGGNATWGAVGQWGGADIGWNGKIQAAQWNHIAYTWDPGTTAGIVYSDGQPATTNIIAAGLDTWDVNDATDPGGVPLAFVVASQNDANGATTEGLRGSLSIARLRVYDQPLTAQAILQIYNNESGQYTGVTFAIDSIVYDAAADTIVIRWAATPGKLYEVQAVPALGQTWSPIATGIATGSFTDKPSTAGAARFYRIRAQ